jgi:hypothetical protein
MFFRNCIHESRSSERGRSSFTFAMSWANGMSSSRSLCSMKPALLKQFAIVVAESLSQAELIKSIPRRIWICTSCLLS